MSAEVTDLLRRAPALPADERAALAFAIAWRRNKARFGNISMFSSRMRIYVTPAGWWAGHCRSGDCHHSRRERWV